jgi:hypothetical protein
MKEINQKIPLFKRYIKENSNFTYNCTTNSSCAAYEVNIDPGVYLLEVWGAKGGDGKYDNTPRYGGAGGYSRGVITIRQTRKMFVMIGGSGSSIYNVDKVDGGNNGGGTNADARKDYHKSSGGGATDIRLDVNDIFHRILVAGGGGGANAGLGGGPADGGVGGGTKGGMSPGHPNPTYNATDGTGGTQTQGGVIGSVSVCGEPCRNTSPQANGIFGFGGNITGGNVMGGPGGGGWYGGAAGNGHTGTGGGGSGFVLNETNSLNAPSGYAFKNSKEVFLVDGNTLSGAERFASTQGNLLIGNNGHGYARITLIDKVTTNNFPSHRMCYAYSFAKQYSMLFITHLIIS